MTVLKVIRIKQEYISEQMSKMIYYYLIWAIEKTLLLRGIKFDVEESDCETTYVLHNILPDSIVNVIAEAYERIKKYIDKHEAGPVGLIYAVFRPDGIYAKDMPVVKITVD